MSTQDIRRCGMSLLKTLGGVACPYSRHQEVWHVPTQDIRRCGMSLFKTLGGVACLYLRPRPGGLRPLLHFL